jgi:hypothetical protein
MARRERPCARSAAIVGSTSANAATALARVAAGLDLDELLCEREAPGVAEDADGLALRVDPQARRALVLGAHSR